MVSDSYPKMMSDVAIRSMLKKPDYNEDLGVLRRQHEASERERELARLRSGSAPPTVEGSLAAVGTLFVGGAPVAGFGCGRGFGSEEELRADPVYANYYYSNVNLNPRLPPPMLSKEDWRVAQQRLRGGSKVGGIGDRRRRVIGRGCDDGGDGDMSMFSVQPSGFDGNDEIVNVVKQRKSVEWSGNDGLIDLPALGGLGSRQRNIAELFQSHPNAKGLFNKPFPYYDVLGTIFGKDVATGSNAEGPQESVQGLGRDSNMTDIFMQCNHDARKLLVAGFLSRSL